jgi:hypothetical protein
MMTEHEPDAVIEADEASEDSVLDWAAVREVSRGRPLGKPYYCPDAFRTIEGI